MFANNLEKKQVEELRQHLSNLEKEQTDTYTHDWRVILLNTKKRRQRQSIYVLS